jgi:L-methionine (R)-S-oxide reductase
LESSRVTTKEADQVWLEGFIARAGGVAGTIHRIQGEILELRGAYRIPPPVVAATSQIPRGKGMAGLAWQREKPVQTCNLKDDESGDVRPGAKAVHAQGAVALPVKDSAGHVVAVVGVAYADERILDEDGLSLLTLEAEAYFRSA